MTRTRRRRRIRSIVCQVCYQGFHANRLDAKFCGDRCRQRAHRRKSVTEPAGSRDTHEIAWLA